MKHTGLVLLARAATRHDLGWRAAWTSQVGCLNRTYGTLLERETLWSFDPARHSEPDGVITVITGLGSSDGVF